MDIEPVLQDAQAFFLSHLTDDALTAYGLTKEDADAWALGWAPNTWDSLVTHLRGRESDLMRLQLAFIPTQPPGTIIDRYRGRLMIPMRRPDGIVVGFHGVAPKGEQPRVLCTTNAPIPTLVLRL